MTRPVLALRTICAAPPRAGPGVPRTVSRPRRAERCGRRHVGDRKHSRAYEGAAAQSASSNSGDRTQLQAEFNTLRTEITRITATTQYQGNNLIDGTMGNQLDTTAALDGS